MSSLIKDVLIFSKISKEGKGDTAIDLNEILNNVKNDFELVIAEKGAQIRSDKHLSLPDTKCAHYRMSIR